MRESLVAFGERETSVVRTQAKKTICQFCHAPFKGMRIFRMRGWRIDPRYWDIDDWDIDEGGRKK
jgi:hypothetical protein